MKKKPRLWAIRLLLLAAAGAFSAAAWLFIYAHLDYTPAQVPLQFDLRAGSSLKSATQRMAAAGALNDPAQFVLLARLLGAASKVKAGNYEINAPISPLSLLRKITEGDYTQSAITFVEGWTFRQMRQALDAQSDVRHDTRGLSEADIRQRLVPGQTSLEGWFYPDTYHFSSGTSDLIILKRALQLMQGHLAMLWKNRASDLPLQTPYEALILASIIEKETGKASDRPLIAAVFINRLRIGMKLQTDPAVIYGLGESFDGNLRKRDLVTDTEYNTYTRSGLPPSPIAMPGLASLTAALNPPKNKLLYFVARGDGSSQFSSNLEEHNRAVNKYQKSGRH